MTQNKGSKIALAVAGLLLIAGAATAIAMTQNSDDPAGMFGTTPENSESTAPGAPVLPDHPAAETGEVPGATDTPAVPGMKSLEDGGNANKPMNLMPDNGGDGATTGGETPKTE